VISAAAGTAAGVALLLATFFARLGLLDPGSAVTGTLILTPDRRLLSLTPVLMTAPLQQKLGAVSHSLVQASLL
jgi:hypothetical protein